VPRTRPNERSLLDRGLDVVAQMLDVTELDEFPAVALDALASVIPYDVASYNEVDPLVPRLVEVSRPEGVTYLPEILERWVELRGEQPLYAHYVRTGDGSATRISDLLTPEEYRATDMYRDVYRVLGVEFQMSCVLSAAPPLVIAIALSRSDRDFTDDERDLLERLRPLLVRIHERARERTLLRQALEHLASGGTFQALAICDGTRIEPVGSRAHEIMRNWFDDDDEAPAALGAWIDRQRAGTLSAVDNSQREPLLLGRGDRQLTARFVPGNPEVVLLGDRPRLAASALYSLGLRPREAEVLLLAADGFDNGQIAATLHIRLGTVRKHLERVYQQLGVTSRAGAVAEVYRLRSALSD
jgi:DNA-binding CsgD family transcriptional regulator